MKKLTKRVNKKSIYLFITIFLINIILSLIITHGQLPTKEILLIKLITSAYLASELPLIKKRSQEWIDPEYAIFYVFLGLVGSAFVLSFIVLMIRSIATTSLQLGREMIYADILIVSSILLTTLILLFKGIRSMFKSRD